jgi:hypothetical protein
MQLLIQSDNHEGLNCLLDNSFGSNVDFIGKNRNNNEHPDLHHKCESH